MHQLLANYKRSEYNNLSLQKKNLSATSNIYTSAQHAERIRLVDINAMITVKNRCKQWINLGIWHRNSNSNAYGSAINLAHFLFALDAVQFTMQFRYF